MCQLFPSLSSIGLLNIDAAEGKEFLFADGRGDRFVLVEDQDEGGCYKLELKTPLAEYVKKCGEKLVSLQPGVKVNVLGYCAVYQSDQDKIWDTGKFGDPTIVGERIPIAAYFNVEVNGKTSE